MRSGAAQRRRFVADASPPAASTVATPEHEAVPEAQVRGKALQLRLAVA